VRIAGVEVQAQRLTRLRVGDLQSVRAQALRQRERTVLLLGIVGVLGPARGQEVLTGRGRRRVVRVALRRTRQLDRGRPGRRVRDVDAVLAHALGEAKPVFQRHINDACYAGETTRCTTLMTTTGRTDGCGFWSLRTSRCWPSWS